ncbi:putative transporter [compost metagenome]
MGVTLLYSILIFMGFEATALFRGEVRNPDRTIPRATYMAVLLIGILYTLSCYGLVSAYGASAWEVAKNDPTDMFAHAIGRFVSPVFTQIAYCSVIMSLLAATLSIHNVLSRYVLNLAGDRVLPNYLARIHAKHSSPHAASNGIAIAAGIILAPLIYCGVDGSILYAVVTGVGGLCVILMLAIVSIAIINWFRLDGLYREYSIFKVFVAPAISACVFLSTFFFAVKHIDLVVGGAPGENDWVVWLIYGALVAGCSLATFFRVKKPGIYLGLGCASQLRH